MFRTADAAVHHLSPHRQLLLHPPLLAHLQHNHSSACPLLLGVVLVAARGVAQLLEVGETIPVAIPRKYKLQNKLELDFPCRWRISRFYLTCPQALIHHYYDCLLHSRYCHHYHHQH